MVESPAAAAPLAAVGAEFSPASQMMPPSVPACGDLPAEYDADYDKILDCLGRGIQTTSDAIDSIRVAEETAGGTEEGADAILFISRCLESLRNDYARMKTLLLLCCKKATDGGNGVSCGGGKGMDGGNGAGFRL